MSAVVGGIINTEVAILTMIFVCFTVCYKY